MKLETKGPLILADDSSGNRVAFRADAVVLVAPFKQGETPVIGCVGVVLSSGLSMGIRATMPELASAIHVATMRAQIGSALVGGDEHPARLN